MACSGAVSPDQEIVKLNQFNGNFIEAEMVKAVISSTEYRSRF